MNKSIQLLAATFGLLIAGAATTAHALNSNQCEVTIPFNGDLNNANCQPADVQMQGAINLNDVNNNGAIYDYQIKLLKGRTAIGALLDSNSNRVLKAGGGQCPTCNDGIGVDGLFGNLRSCILQTAHSATKVRIGFTK